VAPSLTGTEARAARLSRLIRVQFGFVWRLLRRIGVSESEAEPAVQQVFGAAAQRIGDIRSDSERAFLFSTALHVAARVQRERGEQAEPLSDGAPALEDLDEHQQSREILAVLLGQMPLELRVVFVLHEIEQLSGPEIAEVVGIPLALVVSRLSDGLDDLATHLELGSDLSESLMSAARDEQPPAGALQQALEAAGVGAVHVDMPDPEAAAVSSAGASSRHSTAPGAPSYALAAKWLGIGLLVGLALTSAVYGLADALNGVPPSAGPR
jgi:RNA polymerase sigma-70 factor, ECF subfamily